MLLESDTGKHLLIDCGTDARLSLWEYGQLTHQDINDVFISHLHADHVGGLEWLGFSSYFNPVHHRIKLHLSNTLEESLWTHVLSGGLSSLEGETANLHTYFDVDSIDTNGSFVWENIRFQLIQTIHVMTAFTITPSFGLFFSVNNKNVYITTDTQFAPHQIIDFYQKATIIFQDCETAELRSGIHAHFEELCTLPSSIKQKMWLYHYQPGELPDAEAQGFAGFVKKGQVFSL